MMDIPRRPAAGSGSRALGGAGWFLAAWLAIVALRLVCAFALPVQGMEDLRIARHLAAGDGFTLDPALGPTALKAPAYPLFLAVLWRILPDPRFLAAVQHLLLAGSAPLLGWILRRAGMPRLAGPAAWMLLLHPGYLAYPNRLEATSLLVPVSILLLGAYLLGRAEARETAAAGGGPGAASAGKADAASAGRRPGRPGPVVAYGAFAGLAVATQPLLVFPALALFFGLRQAGRRALVAALVLFVLPSGIWTARNARALDRWVPLKSSVWMNVWLGWCPEYAAAPRYAIVPAAEEARFDSLQARYGERATEGLYRSSALARIQGDPAAFAERTAAQMATWWSLPPRLLRESPATATVTRILPAAFLNLLLFPGLLRLARRDPGLARAILAFLLPVALVYGLTQISNARFKLDVEWLTVLPAAAALARPGGARPAWGSA